MFDILDRPLVWIPVRWPGLKPGGADGTGIAEAVENEIELQIEIKEADEVTALLIPEDGKGGDKIDAIMSLVSDWRRVMAGGEPLPFNRDNAALMIKRQTGFFDGFRLAYLNAVVGVVEVREGNSDASPRGGRAGGAASKTTEKPKRKKTANGSE